MLTSLNETWHIGSWKSEGLAVHVEIRGFQEGERRSYKNSQVLFFYLAHKLYCLSPMLKMKLMTHPGILYFCRRRGSRNHLNVENPLKAVNEKCAAFLESLIEYVNFSICFWISWIDDVESAFFHSDYLQPLECTPFHEATCFKNVENLQAVRHS